MDIRCVCPPKATGETRHATDRVKLRERLDLSRLLIANKTVRVIKAEDPNATVAEILAGLSEVYLYVGIESWTLVDGKGKPLPVTKDNIRERIVANPDVAFPIIDEADDLYTEAVTAPLVAMASSSSPDTSTDDSTSPPTGSTPSKPPSKRYSITTTQTDDIVTMRSSPVGVSSSSPS